MSSNKTSVTSAVEGIIPEAYSANDVSNEVVVFIFSV